MREEGEGTLLVTLPLSFSASPSVVLGRPSVVGALEPTLPIPNPTTLLNPAVSPSLTYPSVVVAPPQPPRQPPVERARETLPPCPQSAYASRVAPATSAWGWPPPPPCSAAPFTASPPLHSFSSDASSALFFPPSFLIPVFDLSSISPRNPISFSVFLSLSLVRRSCFASVQPSSLFTLLPWFRPHLVWSLRERESKKERTNEMWGEGMEGWSRRKRNEERNGTTTTAPLEANRINVFQIIHAYFRATRGNVC